MSPEILRGDPFGLSTDVYSLGIIFCELISMKLAGACAEIEHEPGFLERVPPRYSLKLSDMRSLLQAQDGGCPKSFIDLSLRCTQADCHIRPTVKEVLSALDSIEQKIINLEQQNLASSSETGNPGTIPSVGSLEFAKSNVKMAGKRSFKRMPSFLGQISIPKTINADSQDSQRAAELMEDSSQIEVNLGTDSLLIDPEFHAQRNHLKVGQMLQTFSTSTLKLPNTTTSLNKKRIPSNFLNHELPPIPACSFPVALPFKAQDTPLGSPSTSSTESPRSEFALPPVANDQSLVSEFNFSQLGSIPTMNSQNVTISTTNSSFQLAINELSQAYNNQEIPAPQYESKVNSKDLTNIPGPEDTCQISSQSQQSAERKQTFSQETVTYTTCYKEDQPDDNQCTSCSQEDKPDDTQFPTSAGVENRESISSEHSSAPKFAIEHNSTSISPLTSDSESRSPKTTQSDAQCKTDSILPHRFTIVRSNWLTNLLNLNNHLKDTSREASKSENFCRGCQKFIGSRKSFLRCDDCGEKCHRKCGDSLNLSPCKR